MKKIILLFTALSFLTINLNSQNWKPVNQSNKYNYKIDTSDFITNTVWIDSAKVIEDDSVFYLNRIMTIDSENNYYANKNQPQFLMRQMLKESDSIYIFSDTAEFILKPLANLSDIWLFNQQYSITATITEEIEELVFDQLDSVKVISLSNGKSLKISKNYGIIICPDWNTNHSYNLAGIEGDTEYGEQVPDFWDFHNFQVGDTIEIEDYHIYYYGAGESSGSQKYSKYKINSVDINPNDVTCQVSGFYYYNSWGYGSYYSDAGYIDDSYTYTYTPESISNKYNHELIKLNEYFEMNPFETPFYRDLEFSIENNLFTKKIYGILFDNPYIYTDHETIDNLLIGEYGVLTDVKYKYVETLGLTEYQKELSISGEGAFEDRVTMHGFIRDGITYGTLHPNSLYLNYINIENIDKNINIYPNPAKDYIIINLSENFSPEIQIEIYDFSGKIVKTEHLQTNLNTLKINVSDLRTGLYIVVLRSDTGLYKTKFSVNRE